MTLMSEIAGYKVQVIATTFEATNDDDEHEELKRQKQLSQQKSAFANYLRRKEDIEREVQQLVADPFYQSELIDKQVSI